MCIKRLLEKTDMDKIKQVLVLLTCLLVLVAVAIRRDNKVWGYDMDKADATTKAVHGVQNVRVATDGTTIINTTELGSDIKGYAGPVPLEIVVKDGKVLDVKALENAETRDFFAEASTLLSLWKGKTIDEAMAMKVDAVSGATFSSKAIINNMQLGLQLAHNHVKTTTFGERLDFSWGRLASFLVVLMAAIIPLFLKSKRYRLVQLILNVVVLGFWTGSFISYSLLVNYVAHGVDLWTSVVVVVMLITAFVYPLFGKKNYYCTHVCPCGSLQDLMGKTQKRKWKMSQRLVKRLTFFRKALWVLLMVMMVTGVWSSWMDYEIFVAFILQTASWVVLAFASIFMVLAIFVPRPYCRFVCPTGTLFKIVQQS